MIEAEMKAHVADPEAFRARLRLADEENSVYYDTSARDFTVTADSTFGASLLPEWAENLVRSCRYTPASQ